jgi:hypothetical protein
MSNSGMVQVRLTLLVESSYWISNSSAKLPEKRSSEGFWCLSKATFGRKAGNSGPGPGKVGENLFMLEKEVSI